LEIHHFKAGKVILRSLLTDTGRKLIKIYFNLDSNMRSKITDLPYVRFSKNYRTYIMPYTGAVLNSFRLVAKRHHWTINYQSRDFKIDLTLMSKDSMIRNKPIIRKKIEVKPKRIKTEQSRKPTREITPEIKERIESFKVFMSQRRYSRSTIKSYLAAIRKFFSHFSGYGIKDIGTTDFESYNYNEFIILGKSHSAQNQFVSALKLFYTLHQSESIVPEELVRPKQIKYLPNVLSKEEVKSIILSTGNLKHRCLLTVIYGAGLRVGEALNLLKEDIRAEEQLLYVRGGKGNKDRRVPLSGTMQKMIGEYVIAYQPVKYLFEGPNGGPYSHSSAQSILRRAATKCCIPFRVTLHTLRHSYATHLLESGVGLRYIQEILGHRNPKTTMIYTHVSGKRLSEVRSPLEDMNL